MNANNTIEELLNKKTASGPTIASAFKTIAGGNENKMIEGVKIFYKHGIQEGKEKGICEGIIISSVLIFSGIAIKNGYKYISNKIKDKQKNDEIGKEIYDAFDDNFTDREQSCPSTLNATDII